MASLLYLAAFFALGMGIVHSLLGEKYILVPLFRRNNLPALFGSTDFTMRTIRYAWHLTTIAWWGFAAILVLMAHPPLDLKTLGSVIGWTFIAHFALAVTGTRGRHMSWIVFLVIGASAFYATRP